MYYVFNRARNEAWFYDSTSLRLEFILKRPLRLASSGKDSTQICFESATHIRNMFYRFFCWRSTIDEGLVSLSDSASLSAKQTKNYWYSKKKRKLDNKNLFSLIFHSVVFNWPKKCYSRWSKSKRTDNLKKNFLYILTFIYHIHATYTRWHKSEMWHTTSHWAWWFIPKHVNIS